MLLVPWPRVPLKAAGITFSPPGSFPLWEPVSLSPLPGASPTPRVLAAQPAGRARK